MRHSVCEWTGLGQTISLSASPGPAHVHILPCLVKPFAKRELRFSATYEATTIRNQTGTVYAITPQTEAVLPDLFIRDPAGRLASVAYRPINFGVERLRTLNLTVNASGKLGKTLSASPGAKGKAPALTNYYAGIGACSSHGSRRITRSSRGRGLTWRRVELAHRRRYRHSLRKLERGRSLGTSV